MTDDGLTGMLHSVYAAAEAVETRLSSIGLSWAKLSALKIISEAGESVALGRLAERLSCVKSNITQLVDRLEGDGLVARQPDPNDRRTKLAVLTPAGRKAVQEGTRLQQLAEDDVLGRLTGDEREQLTNLLAKLGASPV